LRPRFHISNHMPHAFRCGGDVDRKAFRCHATTVSRRLEVP
jgi:hypothetical protein